jgi:Fur family ferric uptake transcriptional regulator
MKCGKVDEFQNEAIEVLQRQIAENLGYELTDHNLYLYGFCPKCR